MRTNLSLFGLAAAAILFMTACSHDGIGGGGNEIVSGLSFSFTVDGLDVENKTRSTVPATEEEQTVNNIYLFFFKTDVNREGELVTCAVLDDNLEMGKYYSVEDLSLDVVDAYNVVAIANLEDNLYISGTIEDWIAQWSSYNEKQFSEEVIASIAFCDEIKSDWIPMSGETTKEAGKGNVNINLTRVVSRLDVLNNATGYELVSASVWNAYYRSSLTGDAVLDYSKVLGSRTQKFYGKYGITTNSCTSTLYAFENQVISPANGDRFTTCLIIGLKKESESNIRYYRINVHPNGSAQNLKRNNSYVVTVNGVNGEGAGSEPDAYAGTTTELNYTINYWDLDDNGLIVSDMYSILAIPTKTVRIGQEGTTNSYTITTFSTLTNPAPLRIKSQIYEPSNGSIVASLSGNTLSITASTLPNEAGDRTGIITVTYADLEASINVVQSSSVDKFLTITLDDEWSNELAATANSSSENVYVSASGPWTATLYDGNQSKTFSLRSEGSEPTMVLRSGDLSSSRFRITTWSGNDTGAIRQGFVLVSLDEDPLNNVSVVPITQKIASALNLNPSVDRMEFNGTKGVEYPSTNTIRLESATSTLKTPHISNPTDFDLTWSYTPDSDQTGTITVTPKRDNYSGDPLYATVTLEDNGGGTASIAVTQTSLNLSLNPNSISARPSAKGGNSEYVTVTTGLSTSKYEVSVITYGNVYNHKAYIELDNGTTGESLTDIPVGTRFRIVFPKVYYPNRDKNISAIATVKIKDSSLTQDISVNQSPLKSNGLNIWSSGSGHYGALGNGYFMGYTNYLYSYRTVISSGDKDIGRGSAGAANTPTAYSDYTYVHISNNGMSSSYSWSNVSNFISSVDGITYFACDDSADVPINSLNNSPLKNMGYTVARAAGGNTITVNTGTSSSRIYQIMVGKARTPITGSIGNFYKDDVATTVSSVPATGIILMRDSNQRPMLVVDPVNRVIFSGEGQMFWNDDYLRQSNTKLFMQNLIDYVCRSAMYGSHFNDMLIDYADGDPNAVPAPWDPVWGDNAWPN